MSRFGTGSNSNGQFWYGGNKFPGFLYKKNLGVGARRSTKFAAGGNSTSNTYQYLYNKYKPGSAGIGASSIATRRAKNRLATVCTTQNCFPCYMTLGQYSNYTHNPNGFVPCPYIPPSPVEPIINYSDFYTTGIFYDNPMEIYGKNGKLFTNSVDTVNNKQTVYFMKYDNSGNPLWVTKIGSLTGTINLPSIMTDTNKTINLCGRITSASSVEFYNVKSLIPNLTISGIGSQVIWFTQYNSNGYVRWATYVISSSGGFVDAPSITVDKFHNVYVCGNFGGTLFIYEVGNGISVASLVPISGSSNFLLKYDKNGKFIWATKIGGPSTQSASSIISDGTNIFISGAYLSNPISVYDQNNQLTPSFTLANSGNADNYLVKYNSSGIAQWATRIAGNSNEFTANIQTDPQGNLYISAPYYSASLNIYNQDGTIAFSLGNDGEYDIYIVKYDTNGYSQWGARIGGVSNDVLPYMTIDKNSNIIVAGNSSSGILNIYNAGSGGIPDKTINFASLYNLFLVKFNSSGNNIWNAYVGSIINFNIRPDITGDNGGNVCIIGSYSSGSLIFYDSSSPQKPILSLSNPGLTLNSFVAKYDSNGYPIWAAQTINTNIPQISSDVKPWA